MVQKNNLIYIKTASDLNKYYEHYIKDKINIDNIVFAPDMDNRIFWTVNINPNSDKTIVFFTQLVYNTIDNNTAQENLAFANRLGEILKEYWNMAYGFTYGRWNAADLKKRAEYTPFDIIFYKASQRGLFGRDLEFHKSIPPEIQILLEKSGLLFTSHDYNFSSQRLEDKEFIMTVLPKQNGYEYLSTNDKKLLEKFEHDFGKSFNPKTAFRGAKNPDVLYEIRSGRINPILGLEKLTQDDARFIIPRNDFKSLSPDDIYNILTTRKFQWEPWQVYSLMQLMIDKVPNENNEAYYHQMTSFLEKNPFFLKPTSDNHKLWMRFSDKFENSINKEKSRHNELIKKMADLETQIRDKEYARQPLAAQIQRLTTETNNANALREKAKRILSFNTEYFNKHGNLILDTLDNATQQGHYQELKTPVKPWKLFGFDKEKKQYQALLDLVSQVNLFLDIAPEIRDDAFGTHKFNAKEKLQELSNADFKLYNDITTLSGQKNNYNFAVSSLQTYEVIKENLNKQTAAKKARMDKATQKLKAHGVKFGEKSGVVLADKKAEKILLDRAIEKMMEKLRKTPANAKKSDQELMEIAIRLVKEKQK